MARHRTQCLKQTGWRLEWFNATAPGLPLSCCILNTLQHVARRHSDHYLTNQHAISQTNRTCAHPLQTTMFARHGTPVAKQSGNSTNIHHYCTAGSLVILELGIALTLNNDDAMGSTWSQPDLSQCVKPILDTPLSLKWFTPLPCLCTDCFNRSQTCMHRHHHNMHPRQHISDSKP